jgi:hypothetical protein
MKELERLGAELRLVVRDEMSKPWRCREGV